MTIEDLKLLVEKHHKSIIHDIEALILEYKTRPLPKTGYKYRRNIYMISYKKRTYYPQTNY